MKTIHHSHIKWVKEHVVVGYISAKDFSKYSTGTPEYGKFAVRGHKDTRTFTLANREKIPNADGSSHMIYVNTEWLLEPIHVKIVFPPKLT